MQVSIIWPAAIHPEIERSGYSRQSPANILVTEMERGQKTRRVATGIPAIERMRWRFKKAELIAFRDFVDQDLGGGIARFSFPHPDGVNKVMKFKPGDGRPYTETPAPGGRTFVEAELWNYGNAE